MALEPNLKKLGKSVRLYVYENELKETIIDSFDAKEWEDFIIISLDGVKTEEQQLFAERMSEIGKRLNKVILMVPSTANIKFYGVEVHDG